MWDLAQQKFFFPFDIFQLTLCLPSPSKNSGNFKHFDRGYVLGSAMTRCKEFSVNVSVLSERKHIAATVKSKTLGLSSFFVAWWDKMDRNICKNHAKNSFRTKFYESWCQNCQSAALISAIAVRFNTFESHLVVILNWKCKEMLPFLTFSIHFKSVCKKI